MPDESLDILVRYSADLGGQKQALAGQEELTDSVKQGNRANEEGTEKLKLFDFHGREARKTMHLLSEAIPGAGLAARAAFNPENIGLVAMVALLEAGVGWLKKWREHLQEAAKLQAQMKADTIEGFVKGASDAAAATAKMREEIRKAAEDHDVLKRKEDELLATLNEQLKVREKLLEKKGVDKDTIGNLSDRARIDQLWDFLSMDAQAREEAQQKFDQTSRDRGVVQPALDATLARLTDLQGDIKQKLDKAILDQTNLSKVYGTSDAAEARRRLDERPVLGEAGLAEHDEQMRQIEKLAALNKKVADLTASYDTIEKRIAAENQSKDHLISAQNEAAEVVKKITDQYKAHEAELDKAHAALAAKIAGQTQLGVNDAGFKDAAILRTLVKDIMLEQFVGKGGKLEQDQANDIYDLRRSLNQTTGSAPLAMQIIKDMQRGDKTVTELLEEILHYLGYKDSQIASLRLNGQR